MVIIMPSTEDLRPLEKRILEVLQSVSGEWVTRGEVARLLERPGKIQPSDIAALEKLTVMGVIEARETPRGVAGVRWEYRVQSEE